MSEILNVPDGWEVEKLGIIAKFKGGDGFSEEYQGLSIGDFPFLKVSDMTSVGNEKYISVSNNYINQDIQKNMKYTIFPKDTIVFAKVGAALLLNRRRILSRQSIIDNNMMGMIVKNNFDLRYMYFIMLSIDFADYVQTGALPSINQANIANINILIPKQKKEQEKIAKILSTLDKTIESTNLIIEKEKNIKKALMQKLLSHGTDQNGKIRSPKTHTYKETELGLIPQEWEVVSLKEVTKAQQGLQIAITDRKNNMSFNSHPYITIQYLKNNKAVEYIENPKKSVVCGFEDILMTRTGNTGVIITNVSGVFHNNFFLINFDRKKIDKTFFIYFLESPKVQLEIELKAGVTTIPDLNHGDFYSINFMMIDIDEQKQIAEILTTQDKKIEKETTNLNKLKELKKGLMNDLLSGKVRVKV
ncbi:MAG: restriction endonuclease subunit S [Arcobacteraceae bacterium]